MASLDGQQDRDLFISHAGEDKATVARPLSDALKARGWTVWLDELELTVGDSISGSIDSALTRSHFGVVVLSQAFFAKAWPQRELAGLAAKEVQGGSKVILPVWHEVDERYIAERSPILADRVGASTMAGIDDVADKISLALERAGRRSATESLESIVQPIDEMPSNPDATLSIPATKAERERLSRERPDWWEHLVFVGSLVQEKERLETKWDDHELRLARGVRRVISRDDAFDFLIRETEWMTKQMSVIDRILSPSVQEKAFGREGEHGDATRLEALANRVTSLYEVMLDWAAQLRNTSVPDIFEELLEVDAYALIRRSSLPVRS